MNIHFSHRITAAPKTLTPGQPNCLHQRLGRRFLAAGTLPFLLLLLALPAEVQAQFTFTTNSGAIAITGYTGPGGDVTIPSETNGLPVTSIGDSAFDYCASLISVTIPSSVTSIGASAFAGCHSLTNCTIGSGVISIGDRAFSSCYSLTSVIIPDTVTAIGASAFADCSSLAGVTIGSGVANIGDRAFDNCGSLLTITVAPANAFYSSLDGVLFNQSRTTLILCPSGKAGDYTVPSSVTNIGTRAFNSCTNLTSITIGAGVVAVGSEAFSFCTSLTDLAIPNSVTSIGQDAFFNCHSLTNITIGSSVASIGAAAFDSCTDLLSITVDPANASYSSADGVLFNQSQTILIRCPQAEAGAYSIPGSVTTIGDGAFWSCTSLTNITVGSNVTSIGSGAFGYCTSLSNITIPDSVTNIREGTFYGCASLTRVTIPDNVTIIGWAAFYFCAGLTNVTFGSSVTNIGDVAFYYCISLTRACFRGNAPSLGLDPFFSDYNATFFHLPGTTGWRWTFGGRPTALWQPQMQATGIRTSQFGFNIAWASGMSVVVEACTSLANPIWSPLATNTLTADTSFFTDPQWTNYPVRLYRLRWLSPEDQYAYTTNNGTITITGYAGPGGDVTIPNTINGLPVTSIGESAFHSCPNAISMTIPNSVTDIRDFAFHSCTALSRLNIPQSVTNIGEAAFFLCTSLTNLVIPAGVNSIGACAFARCSSLISVAIPSSVSSFGHGAFYGCTSLIAITAATSNAFYSSVDGVLFNKDQTTLVEWPEGKGQTYSIPNGVTTIGESAFYWCTSLTNANIPNTVTNIGHFAFNTCTRLPSITIPDGVSSIGMAAFGGCSSLKSIAIPASVTEIGLAAFSSCSQMSAINVNASNAFYCDMEGILFNKLRTVLIQYPAGKLGDCVIPPSVTSIEGGAFDGCHGLTSVSIPNGVTLIPNGAFSWCTSLASVSLPAGVTTIGANAFFYCLALTNVVIPSGISYLANEAFAGCFSLSSVYFEGSAPSIGAYVFDGDNNATVYYLPWTTGWGSTFAGRPALLWNPQVQTSGGTFGVRTNRLGFTITGTSNLVVVVEACTSLANPIWSPLATNTLTAGTSYFSDPDWTNYPARFYRLRSP